MSECELRLFKTVYLVKNDKVIECNLLKCVFYPLGYGYTKMLDNNLYALTKSDLKFIYASKEEADNSIHNLFQFTA